MIDIKNMIKTKIEENIRNKLSPEDIELISDLGIVFAFSLIFILTAMLIISFILFYSSPWIIAWSILLILLKIRFCESGLEISLIGFLKKYFKITVIYD